MSHVPVQNAPYLRLHTFPAPILAFKCLHPHIDSPLHGWVLLLPGYNQLSSWSTDLWRTILLIFAHPGDHPTVAIHHLTWPHPQFAIAALIPTFPSSSGAIRPAPAENSFQQLDCVPPHCLRRVCVSVCLHHCGTAQWWQYHGDMWAGRWSDDLASPQLPPTAHHLQTRCYHPGICPTMVGSQTCRRLPLVGTTLTNTSTTQAEGWQYLFPPYLYLFGSTF